MGEIDDERMQAYWNIFQEMITESPDQNTDTNPLLVKAKQGVMVFKKFVDLYLENKKNNPFQTLLKFEKSDKVVEKYETESNSLYNNQSKDSPSKKYQSGASKFLKNKQKAIATNLKETLQESPTPKAPLFYDKKQIVLPINNVTEENKKLNFNVQDLNQTAVPTALQISLKTETGGSLFTKNQEQKKPTFQTPNYSFFLNTSNTGSLPTGVTGVKVQPLFYTKLFPNKFSLQKQKIKDDAAPGAAPGDATPDAAPEAAPGSLDDNTDKNPLYQQLAEYLLDTLNEPECEDTLSVIKSFQIGASVATFKLLRILEYMVQLCKKMDTLEGNETDHDQQLASFGKQVYEYMNETRKKKIFFIRDYEEMHKILPNQIKTTMNSDMRFIIKSWRTYVSKIDKE